MLLNNKTYYRNRIILTFTGVTAGIILLLITVSNIYVKELFIDQVSDQVRDLTGYMTKKFDERYLKLLKMGPPTSSFRKYFQSFSILDEELENRPEIFIFDSNFKTIIHNNKNIEYNSVDPFLTIYSDQINKLKEKEIITSLPFKTTSGNWYLCAFYKFDENFYLAYKAEANRFNQLEQFSTYINYFALGSILLICIIALFLAKSISKPINELVKYSLTIGGGQSIIPIPSKLKGEIKILGDALDKMHNGLLSTQKEKENMLAQIAHEIRNPLGGIELLTSLVKEQSKENDKNDEYLGTILKEIFRLKSLITSFLNYSKPLPANPKWILVDDILSELSSFIKNKTTNRKIEFKYDSKLEKIFFDPIHMKQILINLISNSIESIESEGIISTQLIEKEKNWILKISDTGKGIPKENYSNLFTPFFTTKKNGTGLGLAICKKLCSENQADILIDENSDETTIIITKENSYE